MGQRAIYEILVMLGGCATAEAIRAAAVKSGMNRALATDGLRALRHREYIRFDPKLDALVIVDSFPPANVVKVRVD